MDIQADGTLTMSYLNYPLDLAQTFTYCSDGSFRFTGLSYISFVKSATARPICTSRPSPSAGPGAASPIANYAAVKLAGERSLLR